MKQLLINFCNDNLSLNDLYLKLKTYSYTNLMELNKEIINHLDVLKQEKLVIICLILSSIFAFDLSNFSYSIHKFISQSIVLSNKEILFHIQEKNIFMYEKNNVLFIINNTNNTTSISLPITYQNSNLYCVNCGDDIITNNNIEVYKYSFYIIEK